MRTLSPTDVIDSWAAIEAAVDATPDIDPWCSGPDWVMAVNTGFAPDAEPFITRVDGPGGPGFALLCRYRAPGGELMIGGLEPLWGFACPLVGPDPSRVAAQTTAELATDPGWKVLVVPGLPVPVEANSLTMEVARSLARLGPVQATEGIIRQVADLGAGHDAWFARRSSRFRQRLRQAQRRATAAGLEVIDLTRGPAPDPEMVMERLLAIEAGSWKGQDDTGITSPEMEATYRAMVGHLAARGRLRALVARLDGVDVGYILGGVRAGRYRGLQISYRAEAAELSVGHLLQWHQIQALTQTGEATTYDLGMDLDYKRRWADRAEGSLNLVVADRR